MPKAPGNVVKLQKKLKHSTKKVLRKMRAKKGGIKSAGKK